MNDWEEQALLERTTKILRKFNTVTYDMLLKHVEGLPLEELQARAEYAAGMAFDEVGMDRFAHFVLDCDFLEIRSRQHLSSKKLFVFVKEDWLDEVNIKIRNLIPRVCGGIYREDTNLEDINIVLRFLPRMARPKAKARLPQERICIPSAKPVVFLNGENGRVRRSTAIGGQYSSSLNTQNAEPITDVGQALQLLKIASTSTQPCENEQTKTSVVESKTENFQARLETKEIHENCKMESFTTFKWPLEEFAVTLLGCDQNSYFYMRPLQRSLQDRHEQLKKSLLEWTHCWPTHSHTMTVIRKEELKVGMIILAMNVEVNSFVRARVDKIEPSELEYPVLFTDLDEGEQFRGAYILNFEIPDKFRKLFFQAIKIGLESHCEYLGTTAIADVFTQVENLQGELSCELVTIIRDQKLPVVKLRRPSDESHVSFKHLIRSESV